MDFLDVIIFFIDSIYLSLSFSFIGAPAKKNYLRYFAVSILFFAYFIPTIYFFPSFDASNIEPYISMGLMVLFYVIIFKSNIINSLFYFLSGFVIIAVFEILMIAISDMYIVDFDVLVNDSSILIFFELLKLIYVLLLTRTDYFRNLLKKVDYIIPYITAAILNIFIFIQFVRMITDFIVNGDSISYFYVCALFFVLFLINILLVRRVAKSQKEQEQIRSYNEYEKMIIPLIENSRAIEHDFKNHLQTLKGLAHSDNQIEFDDYLNSINTEIQRTSKYKICDNPVMGALLQEKSNYADAHEIDFDINVHESIPDNQEVKPHHLIAIISNLIDNAFEEVLKIKNGEKKVYINYTKNNNVTISVKNTLSSTPAPDISSTDTTKLFSSKGKSHGYGLSNVKKIAKEYEGEFQVFHQDNAIEIKVILNP